MPVFRYSGYRTDGRAVSGTLDADGRRAVIQKLKSDGIHASRVDEQATGETAGRRASGGKAERLPLVTRNLATMINAGVPVVDSLAGLAADEQGQWKEMLMSVKDQVSAGASMSAAFEEFPGVFPDFYVGMVAAGEASGALGKILNRLADFLESSSALRARVQTALIYPIFMTVVSTGILSFLMSFVVPKIARIFENTGNALPVPTRVLLATSNVMRDWWWAMLAVTFLAVWQIRQSYSRNRIKYDAIFLRVPLVGRLILELSMARFSRTLGLLLEGGIPIVRAIGFASRSMGNLHLRGKAEYLAERLTEGVALAAAMREAGVFPATLITLVSTGERSGRLAEILLDAGDAFERDFDKGVTRAVSVFEPAMIVGMGLTVGLIVVSILLPIFRMSQMVK